LEDETPVGEKPNAPSAIIQLEKRRNSRKNGLSSVPKTRKTAKPSRKTGGNIKLPQENVVKTDLFHNFEKKKIRRESNRRKYAPDAQSAVGGTSIGWKDLQSRDFKTWNF
jgi:hypothetical protein